MPCDHSLRGFKVPDSAVLGLKVVVAGWFGQVEGLKNRQMLVVQAGPLGDRAGVGGEGDEPDGVQGVGEVPPGVAGLHLDGADQEQGEPANPSRSASIGCLHLRVAKREARLVLQSS